MIPTRFLAHSLLVIVIEDVTPWIYLTTNKSGKWNRNWFYAKSRKDFVIFCIFLRKSQYFRKKKLPATTGKMNLEMLCKHSGTRIGVLEGSVCD